MTLVTNKSIIETLGLQNLNASQINFLRYIERKFKITAIEDFYYTGFFTGSELLTYSATKIYLALDMKIGIGGIAANTTTANFILMNEIDSTIGEWNNNSIDFQTPDQYYNWNPLDFKNIYFSRIQRIAYEYTVFNGFKLTIIP